MSNINKEPQYERVNQNVVNSESRTNTKKAKKVIIRALILTLLFGCAGRNQNNAISGKWDYVPPSFEKEKREQKQKLEDYCRAREELVEEEKQTFEKEKEEEKQILENNRRAMEELIEKEKQTFEKEKEEEKQKLEDDRRAMKESEEELKNYER